MKKLNDSNFHAWKQKIQLLLASKDLDEIIEDDEPDLNELEFKTWQRKDKKAQACIGLTLSDSMLENVRECETAKEMWETICDVFEKHTLLNKLAARRRFYTAEKLESESILAYSNRIRQLGATLKSMRLQLTMRRWLWRC